MTPLPNPSLVIQTSHLGDAVLTTPLIRRLAARGPVDVVTTPAASRLLEGNPYIRTLYVFNKQGSRLLSTFRIAAALRRRQGEARYHAAYLAQGSVRSALIAILAGVSNRVGFETSYGAWLYTTKLPHRADWHHAHRLWSLAGPGEPDALRPELHPSRADYTAADAALKASDLPLVVLAPGSKRATKKWPYFADLAALLGDSATVAIIGGREDGETAAEIIRARNGKPTIPLEAGASPMIAAALIARAQLVVCNDSVAMHMAAAFDVPVIAVFGPTVPAGGFAPLSRVAVTVEPPELACRPCATRAPHSCPRKHWRCMRDIAAASVALEVRQLLAGRRSLATLQ